ncbi:unnamed protein product [Anisakis simplex]|uniref:DUF3456 domain-containing protein n=1 Tax=Anisakis simplex TaxID=6269 RepID=A0A0M3J8E3_ANISI|nr:unnamed protein product [Anisakis simplex]
MYACGLIVVIIWYFDSSYAVSQSSLACGACSLIINELEAGIASVDSGKKIQIGSFRVDPKGDQNGLNEVCYHYFILITVLFYHLQINS